MTLSWVCLAQKLGQIFVLFQLGPASFARLHAGKLVEAGSLLAQIFCFLCFRDLSNKVPL